MSNPVLGKQCECGKIIHPRDTYCNKCYNEKKKNDFREVRKRVRR